MAIQTRLMQSVYFATVQLYYACIAFPATCLMIGTVAWFKGEAPSILSYSFSQVVWLLVICAANFC